MGRLTEDGRRYHEVGDLVRYCWPGGAVRGAGLPFPPWHLTSSHQAELLER